MADNKIALLIQFFENGNGKLSKRATTYEFSNLSADEVLEMERKY